MLKLTKEPWFGKKTIGLGFKPITWQGWITTLIFLLLCIFSFIQFKKSLTTIGIIFLLIIVYFIVAMFTGIKTDFTLKENR